MSNANVFPIESLSAIQKKIAQGMSDAALGPMRVADDVIALSTCWDSVYRAQAEGKPLSEWLKKITPQGLPWFVELREAVDVLGQDVRRWMDHRAVRWVAFNVDKSSHAALKAKCHAHWIKKHRVPITFSQAHYMAAGMGLCSSRPKAECERCATLEALLKANGIEVNETAQGNE